MTRARRWPARWWLSITLAVCAISLIVAPFWKRPRTRQPSPTASQIPPGYVADTVCAQCHGSIASSYARTGMGQDWRSWPDATPIEQRPAQSELRQAGPFSYQTLFRDGRHVQREFRHEPDAQEYQVQVHEAAYVLGSGLQGRAYVASDKGYLTILPLGWYSDKGRWDLNPNYETKNLRFARPVTPACMSCHNTMVAYRPGSNYAYEEPLPPGIGCQRCHGPGAEHVAAYKGRTTPATDPSKHTIVNPADLPPDLQQDVCLQCHLTSDMSVLQSGFDDWGFRPGMRLRDVRSDFLDESRSGDFRAVGHGVRSMASACYDKSGGRMTCVFCHDPHKPSSEVPRSFYNGRCLECHSHQPCTRALEPGEAADSGDCVSCHMPKQDVSDIPHAAATEHWIRRPRTTPQLATARGTGLQAGRSIRSLTYDDGSGDPSHGRPKLKPFWPDTDEGQLGAAYIAYFGPFDSVDAKVEVQRGVTLLENALKANPEKTEWHYHLGRGYFSLGQWESARDQFQAVPPTSPNAAEARRFLAQALISLEQKPEAIRSIEDTLSRWPWHADSDLPLAQLYWEAGLSERLVTMEENYFQHHPDNLERLELVARALERLGRPLAQVNQVLERAAQVDGSKASPYLLMAGFAGQHGDTNRLTQALGRALRAEPESSRVRLAWASYLASEGKRSRAVAELRKVLITDPGNEEARRKLQELGHQ